MNIHVLALMLACNISSVLADACDVTTRSQSVEVPALETHACYRYEGMPADTISWSCGNESKEMLATKKRPVQRCSEDYVASCRATMTQETLANPHAISNDPKKNAALLPDNAQIITYYYAAQDLKQIKVDCEIAGGQWEWK